MALDVGTLVANLKMDRSDFNRGADESEKRFSRLAGALGTAAVRVGAAGVGVISAAGAVGLSTAAKMEQAEIGFTTMLGSGAKAQVFLKDLSAFAAKTPFEFPELQTAASSLVSAGVNASKVIPIMTSLGNATSGMGTGAEGVKRATVALQQMNAAGKITGEDLNQLRDAGIPVYDLLAAATGKSKEAVAELAQKGKLGRKELEQLMGALESGKGLERFTGLMEKQSQSLTGMWSTLKDTFSMGMASAIQPLLPLIKDGLGGATAFLGAQLPKLTAGLASLVGWAREAYSILFQGDFKGGLVAGLSEDSGAVSTLFTIRETAIGLYDLLFRGDFSGGFLGLQEDSGAIAVLFTVRETVKGVAQEVSRARVYAVEFWRGLSGGNDAPQFNVSLATIGTTSDALQERLWDVREAVAGLFPPAGSQEFEDRLAAVHRAGVATRNGLATVREAVAGLFPKAADGSVDFAAGLDKVEAGARKVWPQIKEAGASLAGLGPVLTVTGAVFGFFADHIDTVIKYMPLLIAGFVAWKTAQALSLAVQITQLPITIALAASNIAYASAVYALLAAMGVERTSRIASIAAWAVHLVQIVAHNVALLALRAGIILTTGATGAITAAQWLWNAALTANPIGLVIAAIALLVGGLVLAWRESETFRKIVVGALNGVKDVTLTVVAAAVGAWFWFADKILAAADKAFGWVPGIGDKVKEARAGMAAVAGAIQGEIDKLKGKDIELDVKATGSWKLSDARAANEHSGLANRRAAGGPIFGPGTGTSDSIPAVGPGGARYALSDGEHVWTAAEVAAMGGHQAMLLMRGAVRRGEIKAFATGGAVGTAGNVGAIGSTIRGQYDPTENALLAAIAAESARKMADAQRAAAAALGSAPGGGVAGRGNVDAELLRRFDAWNASIGGGLRIVSGFRSSARQAELYALYLAGRGNLAARPGSSNHEKSPARAIDYGPASWARTASSYAFGLKAPIRSEPWHLERAFDNGGMAYGTGMMVKRSIPPERVLSGRQTEAFERLVDALDRQTSTGGGAAQGGVTYSGPVYVVDPDEFARKTVARQRDALAVAGLS